jgi:hypothetical protein
MMFFLVTLGNAPAYNIAMVPLFKLAFVVISLDEKESFQSLINLHLSAAPADKNNLLTSRGTSF